MSQNTITDYFSKRKRHISDDIKASKVIVIDNTIEDGTKRGNTGGATEEENAKIRFRICDQEQKNPSILRLPRNKVLKTDAKKYGKSNRSAKTTFVRKRVSFNCDIRHSFSNVKNNEISQTGNEALERNSQDDDNGTVNGDIYLKVDSSSSEYPDTKEVVAQSVKLDEKSYCFGEFNKEHQVEESIETLSPTGDKGNSREIKLSIDVACAESDNSTVTNTMKCRKELGLMTPKRLLEGSHSGKELSINEIKNKLSRSSRLAELKESISRLNNHSFKLKELEAKRKALSTPEKPQLQKFEELDVEVQLSPQKNLYGSPRKLCSPLKSPLKSPAHQRYAALARAEKPALPLPYSYRCLAEAFRCLDTVVSMLYNRNEAITFSKVSPAVREMLRKEFTEADLGQIKNVYPGAYKFAQEKCHSFGCAVKREKYELTLTPMLSSVQEGSEVDKSQTVTMTPSYLLERRNTFHNNLLEIVKDHHEEFLKSLDPPVTVNRLKLMRWHPEFDVDKLPSIQMDSLPKPPNETTYSTAKDVLERAKDIFHCNKRMETALKVVSDKKSKIHCGNEEEKTRTIVTGSDSGTKTLTETFVSGLFKGIPKSILEKVRAKQAAKAIKEMTMKPEEEKEMIRYTRLPEMARILRILFVGERKRVLPLETVLDKLRNSSRENLSTDELMMHIQLLIKSVPGWLELQTVRTTKYVRLSLNGDMVKVMTRLEELAEKKYTL